MEWKHSPFVAVLQIRDILRLLLHFCILSELGPFNRAATNVKFINPDIRMP